MKRILLVVFVSIILEIGQICDVSADSSLLQAYSRSPLPANAGLVVSAFNTDASGYLDQIEFSKTSTSSEPFKLDNYRLDINYLEGDNENVCSYELSGYMLTKSVVYKIRKSESDSQNNLYLIDGCKDIKGKLTSIDIFESGRMVERVGESTGDKKYTGLEGSWQRKSLTTTYRKGIFTSDFSVNDRQFSLGSVYFKKDLVGVKILEVSPNPVRCLPVDSTQIKICNDYIKIFNSTDRDIDLSDVNLIVGSGVINLDVKIPSQKFVIYDHDKTGKPISIPASEGQIYFEDGLGLYQYFDAVSPMAGPSKSENDNKVWSWNPKDNIWQWAYPSLDAIDPIFEDILDVATQTNLDQKVDVAKQCQADQEINLSTGRCKKKAVDSSRKPCTDNQYRSEETGRCRNITIAKAEKACAEDQFKNPSTGRCKKIASSEDPQPCDEGKVRNPKTGRCKMVQSKMPKVDFPTEAIGNSTNGMAGWWAFGGTLTMAAGYGAWEWRQEFDRFIKKVKNIKFKLFDTRL